MIIDAQYQVLIEFSYCLEYPYRSASDLRYSSTPNRYIVSVQVTIILRKHPIYKTIRFSLEAGKIFSRKVKYSLKSQVTVTRLILLYGTQYFMACTQPRFESSRIIIKLFLEISTQIFQYMKHLEQGFRKKIEPFVTFYKFILR